MAVFWLYLKPRGEDDMKHNKIIIAAILILTLASSAVFAASIAEKMDEPVEFSSLDLATAEYNTIIDSFQAELASYESQCNILYARMEEARSKGDVSDYFDAKDFLRSLERPSITEEQTEILIGRILNESDDEAKASFAAWLYDNSSYYSPSIILTRDTSKDEGLAKYFDYTYKMSTNIGGTVKLPSLSGYYTPEGGVFVGWGITPDEVTYEAGTEIDMPYSDLTLYAIFKTGILFVDSVTGTEVFADGSEISAPELEAPDDSYVFLGWYDILGKKVDGSETLDAGASAVYYAKWRSLDVEGVYAKYYDDLTVPAETQIKLCFSVANKGNKNAGSFTVELVPENESALKVISGSISAYSLHEGMSKNGSFTVIAYGNSGDKLNATIVVTDADGNTWTEPVTLTIK